MLLHIHPTVSDVTDQTKELTVRGQTDSLPLAFSQIRESDSIVRAHSGQIIVIGGLMRQTRQRPATTRRRCSATFPGSAGCSAASASSRAPTELVILLRPLVVDDDDEWPQLVQEPTRRVDELARKGKLQ